MAKKFKLNIKQADGTFVEYKLDINTDDVKSSDGSKSLTQVLTNYSTTDHKHNYAGSSTPGGAATSANKVNSSLTVKLNGGTTEGTNQITFDGSAGKTVNITPDNIGAAKASHGNHVPATETANNAKFLRNDNTWQTVTPANIGASPSGHNHDDRYFTESEVYDVLPCYDTRELQNLSLSWDTSTTGRETITKTIGTATYTFAKIDNLSNVTTAVSVNGNLRFAVKRAQTGVSPIINSDIVIYPQLFENNVCVINVENEGYPVNAMVVIALQNATVKVNSVDVTFTKGIWFAKIVETNTALIYKYMYASIFELEILKSGELKKVDNKYLANKPGLNVGMNGEIFNDLENNTAGEYSHAEGYSVSAQGAGAHAEGYFTKASSNFQHVQGKFNIEDTENNYAHIVGNGSNEGDLRNAHTLDWDGNAWFAGNVSVGPDNKLLATADHTHPAQTTVSGNAGSATKLQTARNIKLEGVANGTVQFDGSKDVTLKTSPILWSGSGTSGTKGYVAFAQLVITSSYSNRPIEFKIIAREKASAGIITIRFRNIDGTDPELAMLTYMGADYGVFVQKIDVSTWLLYATKGEAYDNISVVGCDYATQGITITHPGTFVTEKPTSGVTDAVLGGQVNSASLAYKVNTAMKVQLNGGTTEGTNQFTFDGSAAKNINITPDSIGAAPASHGTHLTLGTGSGNAFRGDYGNTAYNHSQAAHAPSNAQKNSDITKAEIEAKLTGKLTSHTHATVNRTTITTPIYNPDKGVLVDFNMDVKSGAMAIIKLYGNSYSTNPPIEAIYQFYDYATGDIQQCTGTAISGPAIALKVYKADGKLKAWFQQPNNYCTFKLEVAYGNIPTTPDITLTNEAEPTTNITQTVTINPDRVYSDKYKQTYSNAALGQGYGTCTTSGSIPTKVVTLSGYSLQTGGAVSVKFNNDVPGSSTMNINNKGAKNIYFRGAAITANIIKAGDIATFIYDGTQYQLIAIDRWQNDLTSHTHNVLKAQDTRNVNETPAEVPNGLSVHLKSNATDDLRDGGQYHSTLMMKGWNDASGGPWGQLTITENNNLWFRSSVAGSNTDWHVWQKVSLDGHTHPAVPVVTTSQIDSAISSVFGNK